MATFGRPAAPTPTGTLSPLAAYSWVAYVNLLSAMTDEAKRVIKAGGLQDPAIVEHLKASRLAATNQNPRPSE